MRIYIEEISDTKQYSVARYHQFKISISEMQFSYSRSNLDFLYCIIINNTIKVQLSILLHAYNGTCKGNIEVINSGNLVSLSKGNKGTSAQGKGVVTTKDGSEKANYTFLQVGKTSTKDGKPVLRGVGSAVWSTDSTGKLAFLDNMLSFFIIEVDEMGNFSSKDRELK